MMIIDRAVTLLCSMSVNANVHPLTSLRSEILYNSLLSL